jgi:hypothetical protein
VNYITPTLVFILDFCAVILKFDVLNFSVFGEIEKNIAKRRQVRRSATAGNGIKITHNVSHYFVWIFGFFDGK